MKNMMPISEIKKVLSYEKDTGLFRWDERLSNRIHLGDTAGSDHGNGYLSIGMHGRKYFCHRLAFAITFGRWPDQVDHINGNRSDNRWVNLRDVSHLENHRNQRMRKNNKSGVMGVHWTDREKRWVATINTPSGQSCLGYFKCKEKAVIARKRAERDLGFHDLHGTPRSAALNTQFSTNSGV